MHGSLVHMGEIFLILIFFLMSMASTISLLMDVSASRLLGYCFGPCFLPCSLQLAFSCIMLTVTPATLAKNRIYGSSRPILL
ncbi:hypothetical protein ACN38_g232 [Penicillium nordicum]|uniref:Uncharacterized protein n=1 Tax=Penicillium nordicum TaxID=229535 RepID=A0A0M8PIE3_9EURO|nr:hypothetical protein ACN38_g232 [Penicillium nordicum]